MKKILITTGEPSEIKEDLKRLFGFKIKKIKPCDIPMKDNEIIDGYAISYKTSKRNYKRYLETRTRYGF